MPSIIVFPGQGSQFIGMGKKLLHLPKVHRMFELANNIFNYDILKLCLNGPKLDLDKTELCQPAVFVTSMAAIEFLKETQPVVLEECYATAGFSLGEYAALVLAGSITYEDALKLIKVRSQAMKIACESQDSGLMTAFIGSKSKLDMARYAAKKWCIEKLKLPEPVVCETANYLNSQVKVIGGTKQALDFIEINYKTFGINRVKRLAVSGAFHTSLMNTCEEPLEKALANVLVKKPKIKFYSNVDAEPVWNEKKIKQNLVKQLSRPVKWEQILNSFYFNENLPINTDQLNMRLENKLTENKKAKLEEKVEKEVIKDFLNPSPLLEENKNDETEKKIDENPSISKLTMKKLQDKSRQYPDIYECGPGSTTGPVLKLINSKAHQFYKHINV